MVHQDCSPFPQPLTQLSSFTLTAPLTLDMFSRANSMVRGEVEGGTI